MPQHRLLVVVGHVELKEARVRRGERRRPRLTSNGYLKLPVADEHETGRIKQATTELSINGLEVIRRSIVKHAILTLWVKGVLDTKKHQTCSRVMTTVLFYSCTKQRPEGTNPATTSTEEFQSRPDQNEEAPASKF